MDRAVPIFVLGLQRSGTTWIGNLLAAHKRVAAVTDTRHHGIHESIFFSHFARVWDWSSPEQRHAALTAFLQSDYGRLAALDDKEVAQLFRIASPFEAFRFTMDCVAARKGACAWVEKSPHHMRHAERIAAALPDARFVLIRRDSVSLVASRRRAYGRRQASGAADILRVIRGAIANAYYRKLLTRFHRRHRGRAVMLDYGDVKAHEATAVAGLLADLGLPPQPGLTSAFAANSSHGTPDGGAKTLTSGQKSLIRGADAAASVLPFVLFEALHRIIARNTLEFPTWTWSKDTPTHLIPVGAALSRGASGAFKAQENTCPD